MSANDVSSLYEPINEYKPFAARIGIVDGPFEYVSIAGMKMPWPFTTRMTVVQLATGDLFLHSPIAFDATLATQLGSLGRIRHLVSPNRGHYAHIGKWARTFPEAITWASPGVRALAHSRRIDVHFERDLGPIAPPEWRDEIDQTVVPGFVSDEVVFFHKETKTLVLADTIMNFEPDKLGQPYRLIARLFGVCSPSGGMPVDLRFAFWPSRKKARPAAECILSWQPERIILSHGRCFEANGSREVERVLSWVF